MESFLYYIISSERLPFALSALVIVIMAGVGLGPVFQRFNPAYWSVLETLFSNAADKLNRPHRSTSDLVFRGVLLTFAVLLVSLLLGLFLAYISKSYPGYGVLSVAVLVPVIGGGALWKNMITLHHTLKDTDKNGQPRNKIPEGLFYALSRSTRLNLTTADNYTITRLGIALMARRFSKAIVAPVFWYLIGGLPMAYIYSAAAFMKWRTSKDGHSKGFGICAEKVEMALGLIPAYITGFLFVLASLFTPTASTLRAMRGFFSTKKGEHCPYPQGGRPVSVLIWALNISIGGALVDYDGLKVKTDWVGPPKSTAQLQSGHLKRAVYMMGVAFLLFMMMLLLLMQFDYQGYSFQVPEVPKPSSFF